MITVLAKLAEAVAHIGTVSEASLYSQSGLVTIDGTTIDGIKYHLSFRLLENTEKPNEDS